MRFISHHITPLVINSLGGGHTNTHTDVCTETISRNQAAPACVWCDRHAPGLKKIAQNPAVLEQIVIKH